MVDVSGLLRDERGLQGKVRWHLNRWLLRRLQLLRPGTWVTIYDSFGAPGDALLTAIICRHVARRFPRLRINCITPNPDLLEHDPHIHKLNGPETYVCQRHWYLEQIENKQGHMNVLADSFRKIGMTTYDYRASVYLTGAEKAQGLDRLRGLLRPVVTINTRSREPVKTWPADRWRQLVALLRESFDVVQLGDAAEPEIDGVRSFAGRLPMRGSMAVLAHARQHIGPDSFLMHAANGLGVPSVILFGGSRTAANAGYTENINLDVPMPCGPCYIHESRGEKCIHGVECMDRITVGQVHAAVLSLMESSRSATQCR